MPAFSSISGRLVEVHRFINVPIRWADQYSARERRELWIMDADGRERKLVVHSRALPARNGHMIEVLTWNGKALALSDLSTGRPGELLGSRSTTAVGQARLFGDSDRDRVFVRRCSVVVGLNLAAARAARRIGVCARPCLLEVVRLAACANEGQ